MVIMSLNVSFLQVIVSCNLAYCGAENPSFTANFAVNKRHIHRIRAYQFVLRVGWEADED